MAANNIIMNGRVAVDPNLVPRAVGMGSPEESPFARVLDSAEDRQASTDHANRDRADTRNEEADPTAPEPAPPGRDQEPQNQTEGRTAAANVADSSDENSGPAVLGPGTPDRGESVRDRLTPLSRSKGADSSVHPVLREVGITATSSLSDGGDLNPAGQVAAISLSSDVKGAAAAGSAGNQPGNKIAALEAARANDSSAATRSASRPGFRTISPQLLQAAEQARDSVFRQIVFRMHGESSEMRVLLDPPELGQLDVNMVVDKAGVMQLSITTERPEMAILLDKHMAELRQVLSQHGIDVAQADVQTRSDDSTNDESDASMSRDSADDEADASAAALGGASSGYIRADGLDFWV